MMNDKLEELGLSDTAHFTNCVGLFDENHACTVSDMAVILEAALDNDLCREVLGAHTYETAPTTDHPEGQILSNWFLRRIEDKDTGSLTVMGAKTGYSASPPTPPAPGRRSTTTRICTRLTVRRRNSFPAQQRKRRPRMGRPFLLGRPPEMRVC